MRIAFSPQLSLDATPIVSVELDAECRDEIVPILRALQHIYGDPSLRDAVLEAIADDVNADTSAECGREGYSYWEILCLSAVRLGCDLNYDKLHDLAQNHRRLQAVMGIGDWGPTDDGRFNWKRIRDNICRVAPETIERINRLIVDEGHRLEPDAAKRVRGDGFVVETDIHYPTESSLIADGIRNVIKFAVKLDECIGAGGWRQHKHLYRQIKKLARKIANTASKKGANYKTRLKTLYVELLRLSGSILARATSLHDQALAMINDGELGMAGSHLLGELTYFLSVTEHVRDTARRRVVEEETVPNSQKVFSVYEPHTELINRGKTPNPIEFGHRIFIVEDAAGFICDYTILSIGAEERGVVVERMKDLQERLGGRIERASFDKGFHSAENQKSLAEIVAHPCLPTTAKTTPSGEQTVEFRESRQSHPGIESAIGGLQSGNGLDRCRDRSQLGYQRYVGLAMLGRNLHTLGKLLIERDAPDSEAAQSKRKKKRKRKRR